MWITPQIFSVDLLSLPAVAALHLMCLIMFSFYAALKLTTVSSAGLLQAKLETGYLASL